MEISRSQMIQVFKRWNLDLLENPDNFTPMTEKENIEEFSIGQSEEFIRLFNELNP